MPVTATPVAPSVEVGTCEGVDDRTPRTAVSYGRQVLSRMKAVQLQAGGPATISWQFANPAGDPVALIDCETGYVGATPSSLSDSSAAGVVGTPVGDHLAIKLRIREHLSVGYRPRPSQTEYAGEVVDAETGRVRVTLPKGALSRPGVYFGEIAAVYPNPDDAEEDFVYVANQFYVIINRSQWAAGTDRGGPPTIPEVRLHLRDSGPEENLLLDNVKFTDAEIALAITRPLDYWNEIPPPVGPRATTQNFPFRYHWLEAIAANLFWMVAEQFRANNLQYSAGGVQVNDQDKEPNYEQAAARRWEAWKDFVKRKKAEINLSNAYGGLGSTYGRYYGYAGGGY